ncbi:hypothetical protein ACVBEF_04400 [Glaciimonas sp. GG7]
MERVNSSSLFTSGNFVAVDPYPVPKPGDVSSLTSACNMHFEWQHSLYDPLQNSNDIHFVENLKGTGNGVSTDLTIENIELLTSEMSLLLKTCRGLIGSTEKGKDNELRSLLHDTIQETGLPNIYQKPSTTWPKTPTTLAFIQEITNRLTVLSSKWTDIASHRELAKDERNIFNNSRLLNIEECCEEMDTVDDSMSWPELLKVTTELKNTFLSLSDQYQNLYAEYNEILKQTKYEITSQGISLEPTSLETGTIFLTQVNNKIRQLIYLRSL